MLKTLALILLLSGALLLSLLTFFTVSNLEVFSERRWLGIDVRGVYVSDKKVVVLTDHTRLGSLRRLEGYAYYAKCRLRMDVMKVFLPNMEVNFSVTNITLYVLYTKDAMSVTKIFSGYLSEEDVDALLKALELKKISETKLKNATTRRPRWYRYGQYFESDMCELKRGELSVLVLFEGYLKGIKYYNKTRSRPGFFSYIPVDAELEIVYRVKPTQGQLLRALDLMAIGGILLGLDIYRKPSEYREFLNNLFKLKKLLSRTKEPRK